MFFIEEKVVDFINSLTIPFLLAMFLAVNMGGSGTSPAFSAAYGANIIKKEYIPGLFGVMVLLGAMIAGKEVSLTLGKGLIEQSFFTPYNTSAILLSISLSLFFANLIGVPQSTSQSTVLSIAGAASALDGFNSNKLFYEIIPAWFILPVVSFFLMFVISKWIVPIFSKNVFRYSFSDINNNKILKYVLILASLYVAFSIGANNVANAAAPIASLTMNEINTGCTSAMMPVIILSVLVVAPCFGIGSSLLGHKVTETTGKEIVKVNPVDATVIAVIVATLLLLASVTRGIPTSLVQLNSAAFFALSVSRKGWKSTIKNNTVGKYCVVWMIAPVFCYLLTFLLIYLSR